MTGSMKVLLHACCGPCSIAPLQGLKEEGHEVRGAFINPNIHPYTEWDRRRTTCEEHFALVGTPLLPVGSYDLKPWLREVAYREAQRCRYCYYSRLYNTALVAKKGRFEAFTSTLLFSKFQNHELIRELGESVESETGVRFLYRDWRDRWADGVAESKRLGMYRQQYCGCIYSEEERFAPRGKKAKGKAAAPESCG